jgi:SAM-dependent methyltransferase
MCPSAHTIYNPAGDLCRNSAEDLCRIGGLGLTQEALDFCEFAPGSRLADIGCGKGATVRYMRAAGFDAAGLDCDPEAIEQAGPYCRLGDSSCLPYQTESLDGVFFECSLSQMENCRSILAETWRALKSGARLAISDLYFRNDEQAGFLHNRAEWQKTITEASFTVLLFEDKNGGLVEYAAQLLWRYGCAELKKICGCGMDELKTGRCGYFLLIAQKRERSP